jgi:uncharacterized protein YbcI
MAHIEENKALCPEISLQLRKELIGSAKEQIPLQLTEDRLVAVLSEYLSLRFKTAGL